jgi:hypothetical protein
VFHSDWPTDRLETVDERRRVYLFICLLMFGFFTDDVTRAAHTASNYKKISKQHIGKDVEKSGVA